MSHKPTDDNIDILGGANKQEVATNSPPVSHQQAENIFDSLSKMFVGNEINTGNVFEDIKESGVNTELTKKLQKALDKDSPNPSAGTKGWSIF